MSPIALSSPLPAPSDRHRSCPLFPTQFLSLSQASRNVKLVTNRTLSEGSDWPVEENCVNFSGRGFQLKGNQKEGGYLFNPSEDTESWDILSHQEETIVSLLPHTHAYSWDLNVIYWQQQLMPWNIALVMSNGNQDSSPPALPNIVSVSTSRFTQYAIAARVTFSRQWLREQNQTATGLLFWVWAEVQRMYNEVHFRK